MNSRCLILDYGMGNIKSIEAACEQKNIKTIVSNNISNIKNCNSIILPGVGSFKKAMKNLNDLKLIESIKEQSLKKPLLGICLGMQLLFNNSEEFGNTPGLGLVQGSVKKFSLNKINNNKIPNIGWCSIYKTKTSWKNTILSKIKNYEKMYFVHSYYAEVKDESIKLSETNYGGFSFCSSIKKLNIFATQFHPEKSGVEGLKIYDEFRKIIKDY